MMDATLQSNVISIRNVLCCGVTYTVIAINVTYRLETFLNSWTTLDKGTS